MTKPLSPPASWRDLSHAELVALVDDASVFQMMLRPRDLVWAQWRVATDAVLSASEAEQQAWTAEQRAFDAWLGKGGGKLLLAKEKAEAARRRAAKVYDRARRRADELYALHQQLCEAERA